MVSYNIINTSSAATTTDATEASVVEFTLDPDTSANVRVFAVARRESNDNTKIWQLGFSVKRAGTNNAQVVGAVNNLLTQGDLGAILWNISVDTSGDLCRVRATGASSVSIDWYADIYAIMITHS